MTILLSSETREEIEECLVMLKHAGLARNVVLHTPRAIQRQLSPASLAGANVTILPARWAGGSPHLLRKLAGVVEFLAVVRRTRPTLILSGFSMLKHRFASSRFRIPHIAYLRGLTFDPDRHIGLSDRVRFRIFRGNAAPSLFNSYSATAILTVSQINVEFMRRRGVPEDKVFGVGPIWLMDVDVISRHKTSNSRLIVLTQAHALHGDPNKHSRQVALLRDLAQTARFSHTQLVIRVHPRDLYDYERDDALSGIHVDRTRPAEFLKTLTANDIILSPLSTFAFEALHLGAQVLFFRASGLTDELEPVYKSLGIEAAPIEDLVSRGGVQALPPPARTFFQVDMDLATTVLRRYA